MAKNFWNPQTQKGVAITSMLISGYYILSTMFNQLPQVPEFITQPLVGSISLLVVSAGFTLYGAYMLIENY